MPSQQGEGRPRTSTECLEELVSSDGFLRGCCAVHLASVDGFWSVQERLTCLDHSFGERVRGWRRGRRHRAQAWLGGGLRSLVK
jgi:hypothetical protein